MSAADSGTMLLDGRPVRLNGFGRHAGLHLHPAAPRRLAAWLAGLVARGLIDSTEAGEMALDMANGLARRVYMERMPAASRQTDGHRNRTSGEERDR